VLYQRHKKDDNYQKQQVIAVGVPFLEPRHYIAKEGLNSFDSSIESPSTMSYLLSKPTKRSETGNRMARLQQRGTIDSSFNTIDARIIPSGRNAPVNSQRGIHISSTHPITPAHVARQAPSSSGGAREMTFGNQVMLQRQKPPTLQKLRQHEKQQEQQQTSNQEQDLLGVISMEEGKSELNVVGLFLLREPCRKSRRS
jgi:hypothetical protein